MLNAQTVTLSPIALIQDKEQLLQGHLILVHTKGALSWVIICEKDNFVSHRLKNPFKGPE